MQLFELDTTSQKKLSSLGFEPSKIIKHITLRYFMSERLMHGCQTRDSQTIIVMFVRNFKFNYIKVTCIITSMQPSNQTSLAPLF